MTKRYVPKVIIQLVFIFIGFLGISQEQDCNLIITGRTISFGEPISDVNISVQGSFYGVQSDTNGHFRITACPEDILIFSHVSYKPYKVQVMEQMDSLYIELELNFYELEETIITEKKVFNDNFRGKENEFETSFGTVNPTKAGYAIKYVDGKELTGGFRSIGEALVGKISGYSYVNGKAVLRGGGSINNPVSAIWDIDGTIFYNEPPLDINNVLEVRAISSIVGTSLYGSQGSGGVIVVKTKLSDYSNRSELQKITGEEYLNQETYIGNAVEINKDNLYFNRFTNKIKSYQNSTEALRFYHDSLKKSLRSTYDNLDIAKNILSIYQDTIGFTSILVDIASEENNPVTLKPIAYMLEESGCHRKALEVYQKILTLLPEDVQSYRNLAMSFFNNHEYEMSWRLYRSLLSNGKAIQNIENISDIIKTELGQLYFRYNEESNMDKEFKPISIGGEEVTNDIRLVFEWNVEYAPFELEFVGPENRTFTFEHTLNANEELLEIEKSIGFSSKGFFIEKLGDSEWMVNLTYYGIHNKKPVYLKVTKYSNWGTIRQVQEISVYKLNSIASKIRLLKFN